MQEVVEMILGTEREAREIVDRAKAQATSIKETANSAYATRLEEAREAAVAMKRSRLEAAKAAAESFLKGGVEQARREAEARYAAREAEIGALARQALDIVLASGLEDR